MTSHQDHASTMHRPWWPPALSDRWQSPAEALKQASQLPTTPPPAPILHSAVVLTEPSRELLLQLVPALHPLTLASIITLGEDQPLNDVLCLPLGAQVTVQVTGLTADSTIQVASCLLPEWCPPCCHAVPHLTISQTYDASPNTAERLVAEGVCGASTSYFPLSEPLPLTGVLGVLVSPSTAEGQPSFVFSANQLATMTLQTAADAYPGTTSAAPVPQSDAQPEGLEAQPPQPGSPDTTLVSTTPHSALAVSVSPTPAPDQPSRVPAELDEFDLWMQQDERLASIAGPLSGVRVADHSNRVVKLSTVAVGDLVTVAPLVPLGSDVATEQQAEEWMQGVVVETLVDDPVQPQGVLVRLEDDTIGHVVTVVTQSYRQSQAAWPTLSPPSPVTKTIETTQPSKNRSPATFQPAGGIKVLRASDKGKLSARKQSGSGARPQSSAQQAEVQREWEELKKRFGDDICEAVLCDCGQSVDQAVQVLLDQDRVSELLTQIVSRSVARVEEEAAQAAAEEDARIQEERAAVARSRKWAPRPGSTPDLAYVRAADKRAGRPAPASGSFPALAGARRTGGSQTQSQGSWTNGVPDNVKLLRNTNSLAAVAAEANMNVKDVEALHQLYPALTGRQIISLLELSEGSVTAVVEELRALGLEPGSSDSIAYDSVLEVFGLSTATELSTPAEQPTDPEWDKKVVQLTQQFKGLARELAEYSLQSHEGDLARATEDLAHSFLATARLDDDARSRQLAAQLEAAEKSYAAVSATDDSDAGPQSSTPLKGSSGSTGPSTPHQSIGPADGRTAKSWQTVSKPEPRKPRTAAEIQKAKLRVSAGKARSIAQIYYSARNVFFQHAAAAHAAGDGKAASELARKGREYGELAKQFRTAANDCAWKEHNFGVQNTFTMDLHGLHVEEALDMLTRQLDALSRLVLPDGVLLKVITGRGNHSVRNVAAIKPAVMEWLSSQGYKHFLEPGNDGVVVVRVPTAT